MALMQRMKPPQSQPASLILALYEPAWSIQNFQPSLLLTDENLLYLEFEGEDMQ